MGAYVASTETQSIARYLHIASERPVYAECRIAHSSTCIRSRNFDNSTNGN